MPTLTVANGFTTDLPGLGRNQTFPNLSEKRITKAVREALRAMYGEHRVAVSCSAVFERAEWVGACEIDSTAHAYWIRE